MEKSREQEKKKKISSIYHSSLFLTWLEPVRDSQGVGLESEYARLTLVFRYSMWIREVVGIPSGSSTCYTLKHSPWNLGFVEQWRKMASFNWQLANVSLWIKTVKKIKFSRKQKWQLWITKKHCLTQNVNKVTHHLFNLYFQSCQFTRPLSKLTVWLIFK